MGGLKIFGWLKVILMFVGALALLKYGAVKLLSLDFDSDDDVATVLSKSPDGRFTAATVTRAGGGAIAPFCSDSIFVFNSLQTIDEVIAQPEYEVYSAECDVFFDHDASPKVRWDSENTLQIDFAIGATRTAARDAKLRASDASGKVRISFSAYR
ncbi:hypothetical protein BFL40_12950 [Pseudomonas costantinii]|nr:hypothetical protein BFL40_12950 [Pseudomonas costantinii]